MTDNIKLRKRGFRPVRNGVENSAQTTPSARDAPDVSPPLRKRDYVVGYRRPPKQSQFKPGQSGNPKGRAKGAKGMNTIALQVLTEKVEVRTQDGIKKMTRIEVLFRKMAEMAAKGNLRAQLSSFSMYEVALPGQPGPQIEQILVPLSDADEAALEVLKGILLSEKGDEA